MRKFPGQRARRAGVASLLAATALASSALAAPAAGAAARHNLMLWVDGGFDYVQIVPSENIPKKCVHVIAGSWVDTKFTVLEGNSYSFQRFQFVRGNHAEPYFPCGGDGKYLGVSADSPRTIAPTASANYWEKVR